jgi:hypothetical protein
MIVLKYKQRLLIFRKLWCQNNETPDIFISIYGLLRTTSNF